MNEIIASILEAEKRSEEIIKNAQLKAKAIRQNADEDSDKVKNNAVALFKVHRSAVLKDAEKKAADVYAEKIAEGTQYAEDLKNRSSDKINRFADEIAKEILS